MVSRVRPGVLGPRARASVGGQSRLPVEVNTAHIGGPHRHHGEVAVAPVSLQHHALVQGKQTLG